MASKYSDYELATLKHKYVVEPGGKPQVNITAMAELLDLGKSDAFAFKAAKLGTQGWFQYIKDKQDTGTRVHGYMEAYILGNPIEARTDELGHVDAIEAWMNRDRPKLLAAEFIVVNPGVGYGGRGDLLVAINNEVWLIDLKTGKHFPVPHTLQLAALRYAERAVYNEQGMLTETMEMPHVDHTADLYTRNDGTFDLIEVPADYDAYDTFTDLVLAYHWATSPEMKKLTKEGKAADAPY